MAIGHLVSFVLIGGIDGIGGGEQKTAAMAAALAILLLLLLRDDKTGSRLSDVRTG